MSLTPARETTLNGRKSQAQIDAVATKAHLAIRVSSDPDLPSSTISSTVTGSDDMQNTAGRWVIREKWPQFARLTDNLNSIAGRHVYDSTCPEMPTSLSPMTTVQRSFDAFSKAQADTETSTIRTLPNPFVIEWIRSDLDKKDARYKTTTTTSGIFSSTADRELQWRTADTKTGGYRSWQTSSSVDCMGSESEAGSFCSSGSSCNTE